MRITARLLTLFIALAWMAAWVGALWLAWQPDLEARLSLTDFAAVADITAGGFARALFSLVVLVAVVLALPVLGLALLPPRLGARPARTAQPMSAAAPEDLAAVRARVDRLEDEVRELREAVRGAPERPAGLVPPAEPSRSAGNHAHV